MENLIHIYPVSPSPICYLAATCVLVFGMLRILSVVFKYVQEWNSIMVMSRDSTKSLQVPPGTMGLPIVGETFSFLLKGSQFYRQKMEKYGKIYKTHILGRPTIRVIGAENVKKILLAENDLVTQNWPTSARLLLGEGSVSQATGSIHRARRMHMQSAFGTDTLSDFAPLFQEKICNAIETWCDAGTIITYPECKSMTLVIAARAMLGLEIDSLKGKEMSLIFLDFLTNTLSIPFDLPGFGFHKGMNAKRRLMDEIRRLRSHAKQNGSIAPTPVVDSYNSVCEKLSMDDEYEVSEGMLDLLYAGHETVTSLITSSVMLLGKHKHVVEKLREELVNNNIHCGSEQSDNDLSYQKIGELKYLNHVVREVLRVCPPVGGGFRRVLRDFELGGYLIPKDWVVIYSVRETQHTSPLFDDAESFIPERWEGLDELAGANKYHYIPFGAGPRGCIGKAYAMLLAKIFVIELVRRCDWTLKNPNPKMRYIPVPVATDHLPITISRRPSTVPA